MNMLQRAYHFYVNTDSGVQYVSQEASDLIMNKLCDDKPCMIGRLGSTELQTIVYFTKIKKIWPAFLHNFIEGLMIKKMANLSGFFPENRDNILKFIQLMIEDIPLVDILGSWRREEKYLKKYLLNCIKVGLYDLEPYRHNNPWSKILEGKNVLVIHPFEDSIKLQYSKRKMLFHDERVLPNFKLITIKSVQSIVNTKTDFNDWFEALNHMKSQINAIDFDIAIIGCGAYGFPLAAHVKRIGKKAVHLGGAVQILFGIKGKRWEIEDPFVSSIFNSYWIKPLTSEVPKNFKAHDGGSYW